MKQILFIDRDGTIIKEAPPTYQLDDFSKLEFYPNMFFYLRKIAAELDYDLPGTSAIPGGDASQRT